MLSVKRSWKKWSSGAASAWRSTIATFREMLHLGEPARKRLGRQGEDIAAKYLRGEGYRIVERNVRCTVGEVDIVAITADGSTYVVVEVKSRLKVQGQAARSALAMGEESITQAKAKTLRVLTRKLSRANGWAQARIDVVAIDFHADRVELRHHAGAVSL